MCSFLCRKDNFTLHKKYELKDIAQYRQRTWNHWKVMEAGGRTWSDPPPLSETYPWQNIQFTEDLESEVSTPSIIT